MTLRRQPHRNPQQSSGVDNVGFIASSGVLDFRDDGRGAGDEADAGDQLRLRHRGPGGGTST